MEKMGVRSENFIDNNNNCKSFGSSDTDFCVSDTDLAAKVILDLEPEVMK